jgi:hypothetical protein
METLAFRERRTSTLSFYLDFIKIDSYSREESAVLSGAKSSDRWRGGRLYPRGYVLSAYFRNRRCQGARNCVFASRARSDQDLLIPSQFPPAPFLAWITSVL